MEKNALEIQDDDDDDDDDDDVMGYPGPKKKHTPGQEIQYLSVS